MLAERPRAHAPRRLPLFFTTGPDFKTRLDEYLRGCLRKGMAPVFRNVRRIVYSDPAKAEVFGQLVNSYVTSLKAGSKFDDKAETPSESVVTLVWAQYLLAQHQDHLKEHIAALAMIDEAIGHTPTILELYMVKAKILKHAGDLEGAATQLNYARELDTADRYVVVACAE